MPSIRQKKEADYYKVASPTGTPSPDEEHMEETEDGGVIIKFDETEPLGHTKFYANLAEDMEEQELSAIGFELFDLIDKDKKARERRDEQYEEGIRRTGLGDEAPGGAQFMGASKVVHPMLTEACIDFSSRVMKEIFPSDGPVKASILGEATEDDIDRGERICDFMNYQCTELMPEMRSELEQMTTQLPLGGGQYIKASWHERKKRPTMLFISIDDIYLPYASSNFYNSERKTHVQYITRLEFEQRIKSGMYRDVESIADPMPPETSKSEQATDKVEGREMESYNEDGLRTIYECFCIYRLTEEDDPLPYIISIDVTTKRVLSIYRNWDEEDDKKEELDWIVEFPFLPWRGAYPIGLTHMIGGLSAAATGALRALLDSALINNFPGLLKLKGGAGGQTERPEPTQVMEIEGSIQDDDVRKLIMPMPFNPPSPVLFELLGFLQDAGRNVIRTTMEETADDNQNTPVGTTMARLEQGMMVFSAIHARLHHAMARLLKVLYRINKFYLEEKELYNETGKLLAYRQDFQGAMTVVPVSDPNIFSESQRFAQIQMVASRAQLLPQIYNLRKVEEMILDRMKIPNKEELLVPPQEPVEQNAINENIMAQMGRPIVAYPDQNHIAHLEAHVGYMMNPLLGMSPTIAPKALPALLEHIHEHLGLWYVSEIIDLAHGELGIDPAELQKDSDTDEKQAFDEMLSVASQNVLANLNPQAMQSGQAKNLPPIIAQLPQVVGQCQQLIQQFQQAQQPQDPTMALGMAKIQADQQMKQMELQHQQQVEQLQAQLKQAEIQAKGQSEQAKIQSTSQIEGAKLAVESRQTDQIVVIEQMKQAEETRRMVMDLQTKVQMLMMELQAKSHMETQKISMQGELEDKKLGAQMHLEDKKMQGAHALEDKKMAHAHQLEQTRGDQAMNMENLKQQSTHALEEKRMGHASNLEAQKAQSAKDMEGMKQSHATNLEGMKQEHASNLETQKAVGGLITQHAQHQHALQAQDQTHQQELDKQRKTDTVDLYKHDTTLQHQAQQEKLQQDHAMRLEEEKAKQAQTLEGQKSTHDMKKTKLVENNKAKVAKDQLQLKEKEGKEQLKLKQNESKQKLALQGDEHDLKMKFKEAEGNLKLSSQKEKAKLDTDYTKQEHKSKLDLLKTKTNLTQQQLKEKSSKSSKPPKKKE